MNEQHDIPVPKAQLQQMRQEMLQKVKKEKKRRQRLLSSTLLCVVLIGSLFSIRMSPTVASYVSKIPGFEPLVRMIAYDKGIEAIMDNEYFEEIKATASANGITVTILGVIVDQSGMIISYEVDAPFDISKLNTKEVNLFQGGKEILASKTYGWLKNEPTQHVEGIIELSNNAGMSYETKDFELIFHFDDKKETKLGLPFTLKNAIQPEKNFVYNKEIDINGQRFTIENVRTSPLRISLDISIDSSNTMQFLELADLQLINENGEVWGSIQNGFSASGHIRDGHYTVYMQSNYFEKPKQLTLVIGSVYAVPKGQDYIEVDFGKQKIVTKPDYLNWEIEVNGKELFIQGDKRDSHGRQLFYKASSSNGEITYPLSQSYRYDEQQFESFYTYEQAEGLTKIDIDFYPNVIGENIEIPLPLNE